MPDFNKDIPQFPRANYTVTVPWNTLEDNIARYTEEQGLDLMPDFQRGHVWTLEQRTAFIEYMLQGGEGGRIISFNHPRWDVLRAPAGDYNEYVILDGLQRLTAIREFLKGNVPVFGYTYPDWTGPQRFHLHSFEWRVFALPTREAVLRYYLALNAGGTPHPPSEIERVRGLLADELKSRETPKPTRKTKKTP